VIAKVVRGSRVQGLVRYLYGPGRFNEHRDPRIVAGFDDPSRLEPPVHDGVRDFRRLDGLMQQPLAVLGDRNHDRPVWHVPVRAHPDDPVLSDAQWADIADEIMHRTGLARRDDPEGVRWFAVRHADDHIHIVATLARQDGRRPTVWQDRYKVRDACCAIELRYDLHRTAPADRTAAKRPTRAEREKAHRQGAQEPARDELRRRVQMAAAASWSETQFFARLEAERLRVRRRHNRQDPEEVTGYAVSLPDDASAIGEPIWYSGGKLAADLSLPQLRARWASAGDRPADAPRLSELTARTVLRSAVRTAAAEASSPADFFARLKGAGVLVQHRCSDRNPNQITGYSVRLPDGPPTWCPGSELGPELSWPQLNRRWTDAGRQYDEPPGVTDEELRAIYADVAYVVDYVTTRLRRDCVTDPQSARDACHAASDLLYAAAYATGNVHLRRAADAYDRAARTPFARVPTPTPAGHALRTAARVLALTRPHHSRNLGTLIAAVTTLIDAITALHRLLRRSPQANAAQRAGDHLARAHMGISARGAVIEARSGIAAEPPDQHGLKHSFPADIRKMWASP
jgi:hypothetical protein